MACRPVSFFSRLLGPGLIDLSRMERNRRPSPAIPRWVLILALFLLLGPSLQALLNLAPVRGMIAHYLMSETGLEAGDLHIRLVPRPRVQLLDVVMRDPVRQEPVLRAERVEVMMALRPLLRKKLTLAKLLVVKPRMTVRRDTEGRWRLPFESTAGAAPARSGMPEESMASLLPDVKCLGGEVELIVERRGRAPDSLHVTDITFVAMQSVLSHGTDLSMSGRIDSDETSSTLIVTGAITSLDQSKAAPPVQDVARTTPLSFAGRVEVHGLATREWSRWLGPGSARQDLDELTDVTVQVSVAPGQTGYDVALSQVELRLDWLVLHGEGGVQGLGTEQPRYTAVLSSSPSTTTAVAPRGSPRSARATWWSSTARGSTPGSTRSRSSTVTSGATCTSATSVRRRTSSCRPASRSRSSSSWP